MLILNRKPNQSIMVANQIKIQVLQTQNNCVKLGIKTPRCLVAYKQEIYDKMQNQDCIHVKDDYVSLLVEKAELLDACKKLLYWCDTIPPEPNLCADRKTAIAAIAKAEGKCHD